MHYSDITEQIISRKLRTSLGATPARTVNAQISSSIDRDGNESPFLRVSSGTYAIRRELIDTAIREGTGSGPSTGDLEVEPQYDLISSFGMFWRRASVNWIPTPKILGLQGFGASPVDFGEQKGLYLQYDGREVIYVGRSTDRPLGRRLYEHTRDRLADAGIASLGSGSGRFRKRENLVNCQRSFAQRR